MWDYREEIVEENRITKYKITKKGEVLSFQEVIDLLKTSSFFCMFFSDTIKSSPFTGLFWEVKPITKAQLGEDFEFVLVKGVRLTRLKKNKEPFQQYLKTKEEVVSFKNKSGDATLVVPNDLDPFIDYAHLAAFTKVASASQIKLFWKKIGIEYGEAISDSPVWLSTAGLGVHWLHVRIDSAPKYYRYDAYKNA